MFPQIVTPLLGAGFMQIKSLMVNCTYKKDGCTWKGELRDLKNHVQNKCSYREVPCPLGCNSAMKEIDKYNHLKKECPNRVYKCPHCGESDKYCNFAERHVKDCLMVPVQCPSPGCDVEIASGMILFHLLADCEFRLVECQFKEVGCTVRLLRQEMEEHERTEDKVHLKLTMRSLSSLKKRLRENSDGELSHAPIYPTTFRVNTSFHTASVLFKASPTSYQMKLKLMKYSNDKIRVSLFMVSGEHDNHFQWPFSGRIKIELLNQQCDDYHYSKVLDVIKAYPAVTGDDDEVCIARTILDLPCEDSSGGVLYKYKAKSFYYFRLTVRMGWLECSTIPEDEEFNIKYEAASSTSSKSDSSLPDLYAADIAAILLEDRDLEDGGLEYDI